MAHYAEDTQTLSITNTLKNAIHFFHGLAILYAFATLGYWVLVVIGINVSDNISWIFTGIWNFVGQFYSYEPVIGGEAVDSRGVVSAICFFILAGFIKSLNQFLPYINKVRIKTTQIEQKAAQQQAVAISKVAQDSTQFVFLLDVKLTNVSNFIQDSKLSHEEINDIKSKFYEALLNNINHNHILQKGFYKKKLYIIYKSFDQADNFIFYARETLNSLSREFTRPNLKIDFLVCLSCLTNIVEVKKEINLMDTILCLDLMNEFISTASFKNHYDTRQKSQYSLSSKGIYNLSQNLNVVNNQEIYTLRERE